ncbi:hypothetical protein P152DRAFT_341176 [Eremomyces bilateralis CBS 781.70]|uniref:Carbohydrate-binding module family 50 protein n=1 Tax=Eremomyces bilateralis CBS 781.70 TaxID=1392243 RepID=A0A6G1G3I4_9PEZI|nr:uncharacterized protein P152DRAFT_341176 [Eremomyces bilateralis CBS 781.70]KAF1812491.1 hypothetical protein P152DRAFT_341176 [Eremomyces bilateralis CBS 781.70]
MGRWGDLDEDEYRLPEGMKRIAYDADTQIYTYQDTDGSIWAGQPGAIYGSLRRVNDDIVDNEAPGMYESPTADADIEKKLSQDSSPSKSRFTSFDALWPEHDGKAGNTREATFGVLAPLTKLPRSLISRVRSRRQTASWVPKRRESRDERVSEKRDGLSEQNLGSKVESRKMSRRGTV